MAKRDYQDIKTSSIFAHFLVNLNCILNIPYDKLQKIQGIRNVKKKKNSKCIRLINKIKA